MKSAAEIERVHDLLRAIGIGARPCPPRLNPEAARAYAGIFCWILEHADNTSFGDWLAGVEAEVAQLEQKRH